MSEAKAVELGFVEKAECPEELTSPYFPSKVGGKPAWLNPTHLPTPEETACSVCGAPRTFLLQMYAPLPGILGSFHRSFFLFMCCNPSCHQHNSARGFRVFRCQLARKNAFYEEEGSSDGESDCSKDESAGETIPASDIDDTRDDFLPATDAGTETEPTIDESLGDMCLSDQKQDATDTTSPLCVVCGSAGPKKCSRCRTVHYCSKHHQTHDWRNGHKLFCSDLTSGKCKPSDVTYDPSYGVCLPEFILVTEEEPSVVVEGEGGERAEEERMRDYHKFIQSGKYHDHGSSGKCGRQQRVQKVMEKAESGTKSDKEFNAFRRRVALEPEQVSSICMGVYIELHI